MKSPVASLFVTALALIGGATAFAGQLDLSYGGRLVDKSTGAPLSGPIAAQVRFYALQSGGTPLAQVALPSVSLVDGIFSIRLSLTPSEWDSVFSAGSTVWLELTDLTHTQTYPRQELSASPYALRVPVDGTTVQFSNGKLSVPASALTLGGDVSGAASSNVVSALQGHPVSNIAPGPNEFLKWNGSAWVPSGVSGAAGGTVTGVTADPLLFTVTTPNSTPHIALTGTIPEARIDASLVRTSQLAAYALVTHDHDGRYSLLAHNHDGTYLKPADVPVCAAGQFLSKSGGVLSCATPPAPTTDASLLTSGTLPNARLSASVSLLGPSVGTAELEEGSVTGAKVADGSITAAKVADGSITATKLSNACASGQVFKSNGAGGFACADDDNTYKNAGDLSTALGSTYVKPADVPACAAGQFLSKSGGVLSCATPPAPTTDASLLTSGTLSNSRLAATVSLLGPSIGTAELEDGSVTSAKIADGGVTSAKIADGGVTSAKIADGGVTSAKIADGGVTSAKIADGSVTTAKLSNACTAGQHLKSNGTGGFLCTDPVTLTNAWLLEPRSNTAVVDANLQSFGEFAAVKWIDGSVSHLNLPATSGALLQLDPLYGALSNKYRVQEFGVSSRFWKRMESNGSWGSWLEMAFLEGTQTFTGNKTFSGATVVSNATASGTPATGALVVTGGLGVGGAINSGGNVAVGTGSAGSILRTDSLELGAQATYAPAAGFRYIDFHSSANAVDYDARILASGGTSAAGTGDLHLSGSNLYLDGNVVVSKLSGTEGGQINFEDSDGTGQLFIDAQGTAGQNGLRFGKVGFTIFGSVSSTGQWSLGPSTTTSLNHIVVSPSNLTRRALKWGSGDDTSAFSTTVPAVNAESVGDKMLIYNNGTLSEMRYLAGNTIALGGHSWLTGGSALAATNLHSSWYGAPSGTTYSQIGNLTIGGKWTLGPTGSTLTHAVNGNLNATGCYTANGNLVAGTCLSDERFKRDIVPLSGSLRRILSLRPVEYAWRVDEFPERSFGAQREAGLIAQEVVKVFPEYATLGQDGYYRVHYGLGIQMHMLAAIQELNTKIEKLEAQNARMAAFLCKRFPEEFPCE